jgi:IclR family acetate operon transcriptional repressor
MVPTTSGYTEGAQSICQPFEILRSAGSGPIVVRLVTCLGGAPVDKPAGPTLISSVQRALRLLEAVGGSSGPVSAKALARSSGLALPTTYHLLRTLVHEGYLRKLPDGYIPGDQISALSGADPARVAISRARPVLQALRDELRGAAYLSLLQDGEIVLVDIADGPATPRVDLWVGFTEAGHATALGKCVLSCLDELSRTEYLNRHRLADLTPRTVTDPRTLLRTLPCGGDLVADCEEYSLGTACVAAPVVAPGVVGAIAVSVPTRRLATLRREQAPLRRAAGRVARALAAAH